MNSPLGSIWRRWDLQVQTRLDANYGCLGTSNLTKDKMDILKKETGLTEAEITSQEKTIPPEKYAKLFVSYITNFTEIKVVAITDHNTGKELDSLLQEAEKTNGKLVIIPGVEISSSQGIHMLCLFDTNKKWKDTWADSVAHFLTELGISGTGFNTQNQPLSSTKNSQQILELTEKKGGLCIFAHIETENGLFKSSATANGGTAHIDIYTHRLCQIVQLPQTAPVSVGTQNIIEGKDPQYGNKSVTKIKCSDSRKLSGIGAYFTWIKADTTFEGLKQIIFEPDERVKIQDYNPYEDRSKVYFNTIKLSGSTNFILPDFELPLNRELIAIIGGRGSGKSALLDTFAFLNEEHLKVDRNGKKKIIEYYRDNEGRTEPPPSYSFNTTLVDKDNAEHSFSKILGDYTNLELPFLYLGQEQLSGIATNDFELTRTVCQLIGIDINEVGQESLISKARATLSGIDNTEKLITDIIQRYITLGYLSTTKLATWIKDYLTKLKEQQTRLSSKETRAILEEINKKTQQGLKLKELSERADTLLGELKNISINQSIKSLNTQLKKMYEDFSPLAVLDTSEQIRVIGEIKQKVKSDMDELRKDIISQKQTLIKQGIKEDVNSLLQASENLQKQISAIETDLQSYDEAQTNLKTLHQDKDNLFIEI